MNIQVIKKILAFLNAAIALTLDFAFFNTVYRYHEMGIQMDYSTLISLVALLAINALAIYVFVTRKHIPAILLIELILFFVFIFSIMLPMSRIVEAMG